MNKLFKKISYLFLVACTLICSFSNTKVKAYENISEVNLVDEMTIKDNGEEYNKYIFEENGKNYITEVHGNEIIVYDESYQLLASATFAVEDVRITNLENELNSSNLFIPKETSMTTNTAVDYYLDWSDWTPTKLVSFVPKFSTSSIKAGVLSALMQSAFTNAALFGWATPIGILCGIIADSIVNGQTVYVKGEYGYNSYCDILRRERVNEYNADGTVKTDSRINYVWLGYPYDYATYPDACRVLDSEF